MTMNNRVTVDFASFKRSPICACDLLSSCIDIIIAIVSAECSRLEVLGIKGIITIGLVVINSEVGQKFCVRFG